LITVTSPAPLTAKLSELNDATPTFEVDANSPAIVNVLPETVVLIP